jgi:hypothetical protein
VKDVTNETVYTFTEVERLKVENLRLQQQVLESQMKAVQVSFQATLESIVMKNNIGTNESVTLLSDFSGFSVTVIEEKEGCQETDGQDVCEES